MTRPGPGNPEPPPPEPDLRGDLSAGDEPDGGASARLEQYEEAQRGFRHLSGWQHGLVAAVAAAWSLFQLSLPTILFLRGEVVRAIHLAFAIALVYLSYPVFRRWRMPRWLGFLTVRSRIPIFDMVLALLAAGAALYYMIDFQGIGARQGQPFVRDLVIGGALVVLLLEAARRAFGLTLSAVAIVFVIYAFTSEHAPGVLAIKSPSLTGLINQLTMSAEGIYGAPLAVSAQTVFLFVLLGAMLEKTGGGRYFVQVSFSLLGRFKGGPAKAAVCASGLTGMVSGSSIANVVTTGTFTIPLMKGAGYPPEKAAAVEVAASTNGQLMPPVMGAAAFIIAEYCNMPYLAVVRAALLPALVSYLALLYITHIEASKLGLRGLPKSQLPPFWKTFLGGAHFLIPLGALVAMLLRGFTPSVAAFWAIVTLAALVVVYDVVRAAARREGLRRGLVRAGRLLGAGLVAGGHGMMAVGVACATAGIIVGIVGMGFGARITAIVDFLAGGNIVGILVLTAIASLIIGMGLPTTATYIVMASLTAGVIVKLGGAAGLVVPLVAAHLFCFFFGILADDTPPVGLAAYAAAAIAKSNPIRTGVQGFIYDLRTAILPFMFVFNTDLLLWNVHRWWHIGLIFLAATAAMFAFAALTQNFTHRRNRWYEIPLLAASCLLCLRPRVVEYLLSLPSVAGIVPAPTAQALGSPLIWYPVGTALFAGVYLLQRFGPGRPRAAAVAGV
ncbi:MAG TPA: TRAP transporter permease [Phycisphaerae bacterium]|nr:TRAP transporter permease [Phycisphaerae bacterium]